VVDKRLGKGIADAGTVLRNKVNELVTGRSEQTPTTLDITEMLRPSVAADMTLYNSDYVDLRNTPQVEISKVNLQPSPSPPPVVPLPQIPDSGPDPPNRPSQADGVLASSMDNNRNPDIAREAAMKLLASDDEKDSAVKQALMRATRILRKMALKMGLIGWRNRMKEDIGDEIEDRVEKDVEEGTWEGLGEGTEEDMEACIEAWIRDGT
jgi:hypothetical protein